MDEKIKQLELKVLYDISQVIEQALNLDQTLEAILRILSEYLSMNRATITLKSGERGHLKIRASHGLRPEERERGVYRSGEGVTGLIFRTAEPFVVPDISKEPLFLNKTGARKIVKGRIAFIGVPIVLHGKPIGVLSVDRLFDEDISFEEDIRFLTILAVLVAQFVSLNHQVQAREQNLIRANLSLKTGLSEKSRNFFGVARSRALADVQQLIRKVASTKASVLLLGESGTGKTLVAQIIHEMSSRAQFPFVKVNCASIPSELVEAELFGYEPGAFTGAGKKAKIGKFQLANGGTLFLDEVGDMPLEMQAKVLRVLQSEEVERLGGNRSYKMDFRVIAATNKDLLKAIEERRFRADLYYRLNVMPMCLPPLRERIEDIEPLANFFLKRESNRQGKAQATLPTRAMLLLQSHHWPGNVRELSNAVTYAVSNANGNVIEPRHLPPPIAEIFPRTQQQPGRIAPLSQLSRQSEREAITSALAQAGGNKAKAAKLLKIHRSTLYKKMHSLGL